MSLLDQIRQLFNEGDYLGANKLQQDNRITDCRDICQNLTNIESIVSMIDDSIASIATLEGQIKSSKSNTLNIKDKALEMEQKETAVEVQCKNLDDVCALIDEMTTNLYLSDNVERVLLHGNLDDETHIEHIEDALNELDRVLSYKIDPTLLQMQCVRIQRERANTIKARFLERFHQYFEAHYYNKQNGIDSLDLLTRLSRYISIQKRPDSFLSRIYGEVTINVKRNFDKFMASLLANIRDYKPPKQSKCGVLSIVKEFEQFANEVEQLFESNGSRRPELDRWYPELVTELFRVIDTIEHKSTPTEMIRLENYKYLHDLLCSIKVSCLKPKRAEAKQQYEAALNAYVARYFGRPLEKVNIFFDGVQAKVAQGVKEEEIGFQLAFSKQELRRVLQLVTLKEVRKGLEEMYRRIEKHAYEPNSNLIEVIWHAMQSEFLSQYKAIQNMIERCYPSSNLGLIFTINNVLQVFSDIAQSH